MKWKEEDHPRDKNGKFATFRSPNAKKTDKLEISPNKDYADNTSISQKDYDITFGLVHNRRNNYTKRLKTNDSVIDTIYTWEHIYIVEVYKDFSYKILSKELNI